VITPRLVVPSAKDGLHCGAPVPPVTTANRSQSSRPPRTGSIAAPKPSLRGCMSRCVVPSAKDGLHCGVLATYSSPPSGSSRPVRQGRAPLRLPVGDRRGPARRVVPSAKDGLHCGRTQDGNRYALTGVVPSAKDGLHCGMERWPKALTSARVVPSAKDGIHCGALPVPPGWLTPTVSSRPPRTGSIAAGGLPRTVPAAKRRPVRQGRAPLRPEERRLIVLTAVRSSRPPRTGSIAAENARAHPPLVYMSSRPPRTGSIAAVLGRPGRRDRERVVPSAKDGLHCGPAGTPGLPGARGRRPVRQGRAPLRHRPVAAGQPARRCRPVRQGRVPLRPRGRRMVLPSPEGRPVRQGRAPLRPRAAASPR